MPKPDKPGKPGGGLDPHITIDENGNYIIDAADGDVRKGDRINLDLSNETEGKTVNIISSDPNDVIMASTGSGNDTINIGDGENDVLGGARISTGAGDDQVFMDGVSQSYVDNHIFLEDGNDTVTLKLVEMFESDGFTNIQGGDGTDTVVIDFAGLEAYPNIDIDVAMQQLQDDFAAYKQSGDHGSFNVRDSVYPTGDPIDHGGTLYLDNTIENLICVNSNADGITS